MTTKSKRGFASMSPERLAEVSARGGRGSTREQRVFFKDRGLAKAAGKQGAKAVHTSAPLHPTLVAALKQKGE